MTLAQKYNHFYAPEFQILLQDKDLVAQGFSVTQVSVDQITDGATKFDFTVLGPFGSSPLAPEDTFSFGQRVDILMGYGKEKRLLVQGIITSLSYSFSVNTPLEVRVEGYDLLFYMMRLRRIAEKKKKSWSKVKDSQVVQEIAQQYFEKWDIFDTKVVQPSIIQRQEETDYQFLKRLGERNACEVFVKVDQVQKNSIFCFAPPPFLVAGQTPEKADLSLTFGLELFSFNPVLKINQVVSKVVVYGWDSKTKKKIKGQAPVRQDSRKGSQKASQVTTEALKEAITMEVHLPVFSEEEARKRAESLLSKASQGLVEGEGETVGIPELIPGKVLSIKGLGKALEGPFYVYQATHTMGPNGYRTTFKVKEASAYVP